MHPDLLKDRREQGSSNAQHSNTPTDQHISLTEGINWKPSIGCWDSSLTWKSQRGKRGEGSRILLERSFCTLRRVDFMPFPAKPSILGVGSGSKGQGNVVSSDKTKIYPSSHSVLLLFYLGFPAVVFQFSHLMLTSTSVISCLLLVPWTFGTHEELYQINILHPYPPNP